MATRYWVGGSGNWDGTTTTHWSATSGGAGGASAPTSADDVVFDANSNTGTSAFTVTITGTSAAPSNCANFSTSGLDGAMTLTMGATAQLNCYASMTIPATNFVFSGTAGGAILFSSTSTGNTLTTNGIALSNVTLIFNGVGGGWTLGSALTTGSIYTNYGTFNTGNFNITSGSIIRNASVYACTVNLGSSTITLSGTSSITMLATNLTFNAGTSTINCSSASPTFAGAGLTFYNVSFTSTAISTVTITGANTFNNLTFAARAAAGYGQVLFPSAVTTTVNGTLTLGSGTTGVARLGIFAVSQGNPATISVATLAAMTDIDFRDITGAGAATWSGTRIGNCFGNTNITFDAARTVYWNSAASANWNGAVWSTSSGNTGGTTTAFPLAQDTIIIDNAGLTTGNTITLNANYQIPALSFASRTNAATFATGTTSPGLYGDYTLSSAITVSGTGTLQFFKQSGTATITSAGVSFPQNINQNGNGGTLALNGNLTLGSTLTYTLNAGTLDLTNGGAGNYSLTTGLFSSSNSSTRAIAFGTGNITVTGSGATVFNMTTATGYTYTGTPTVNLTYSGSTGTRTIGFGSVGASEANVPDIYVTAGSDIVATSATVYLGTLNFTGFTGTFTRVAFNLYLYRNLVLNSGMTYTAVANSIFFSSNVATTQTITTNGVTINSGLVPNGTQTVQLQDNLTIGSANTFNFTSGTFDANGKNVSTGLFNSSNTNTRTLKMGSGTWTLTGTGTVWAGATTTGMTLVPSTSTIVFNGSGIGTFNGGGLTFNNLTQSSSNALTISSSNTFNTISNTVSPTTITFGTSTNTKVTNFNVNGTAGNLVTINSTVAGTQAIITSPTGVVNTVTYTSLQDNNATGGTWYAPSNQGNTIVSNVTGWMTSALYFEGITEAGSASDLQNESMATNSVITELGSATDTQSESMSAPANISEVGNALDTQSESLSAPTTISEAGNAQDNVFQTLTAYCVISEAGNAQDIQLEAMSALLSIIESGLASDTVSQQLIGYASVAENGNALDTVTENMRANVSVVEAGNAQDFLSKAVIAPVNISESGNAQDTQSEKVYVYIAIIENGNAIDVYYCKPIFNTSEKIWHVLPRRDYWHAND